MKEKIDKIEVVSGKTAMHALTSFNKGLDYNWEKGVEDPYRIIGLENSMRHSFHNSAYEWDNIG